MQQRTGIKTRYLGHLFRVVLHGPRLIGRERDVREQIFARANREIRFREFPFHSALLFAAGKDPADLAAVAKEKLAREHARRQIRGLCALLCHGVQERAHLADAAVIVRREISEDRPVGFSGAEYRECQFAEQLLRRRLVRLHEVRDQSCQGIRLEFPRQIFLQKLIGLLPLFPLHQQRKNLSPLFLGKIRLVAALQIALTARLIREQRRAYPALTALGERHMFEAEAQRAHALVVQVFVCLACALQEFVELPQQHGGLFRLKCLALREILRQIKERFPLQPFRRAAIARAVLGEEQRLRRINRQIGLTR